MSWINVKSGHRTIQCPWSHTRVPICLTTDVSLNGDSESWCRGAEQRLVGFEVDAARCDLQQGHMTTVIADWAGILNALLTAL